MSYSNFERFAVGLLCRCAAAAAVFAGMAAMAQGPTQGSETGARMRAVSVPPRVAQAERFLARRGWTGQTGKQPGSMTEVVRPSRHMNAAQPLSQPSSTATWQAVGPAAVVSPNFGLVTGRVAALAMDPSDPTGNRLYLGTTGGGVWMAENAGVSNPSYVVFTPLTDNVGALDAALDASISIGALAVQPGGTGVILAGTGDPNDALDSYYGAGILRSEDGGNSWDLIQGTQDKQWGFAGEGFAGFAWSTTNLQLVVAAVSQAYGGVLVNAVRPNASYEGLYYSTDSGMTWNLARITDGSGVDVQGPNTRFAVPDGNAATSVVWNPVRRMFLAAVRFHGYYQSSDGVTWTRMAAQPGTALSVQACPTNTGVTGSINCPIFRGTLAVNPLTGDTFAWTVDAYNQDQGIWQDQCGMSGSACSNQAIAFGKQWSSADLETNDSSQGPATIENGDYTLALVAVPLGQDTLLLVGDQDLWRCSLAEGCVWRNTTNSTTCMSAGVGEYQHALAWSLANPLGIFVGNDSGIWRSTDGISETGPACASTDAAHFQNLNGAIGSLAEVMSLSQANTEPLVMMTGLGVNGTAGVKNTSVPTADWPVILGGEGGAVAIDQQNGGPWYANNQPGVSIHSCAQASDCTPAVFGANPVVTSADVGGDGDTMGEPAPFLVDPVDPSQLLIGTCRMWRGPANGAGWGTGNAISPIFDGGRGSSFCNGDALIRSMAAMPVAGGEMIYVGMYGVLGGGASLAGHVLSATFSTASGLPPVWRDLSRNPVLNDLNSLNAYGFDVSSISVDAHDSTGNTVYVTVAGIPNLAEQVQGVYRSTDGGAHWASVTANLPIAPVNSLAVDPQDANTVYLATDAGVYFTRQITACPGSSSTCWSAYGAGLPGAPVVALSTTSAASSTQVLTAATYGRGIWQIPLWTAGTPLTTATLAPASLTFANQVTGTTSSAQTVTLTNTGGTALEPASIAVDADFGETDDCQNAPVAPGSTCTIRVTFTPTNTGSVAGQLSLSANVPGGGFTVALSGTGTAPPPVNLSPSTISFGMVAIGTTSLPLQVTASNGTASAVAVSSIAISPPFTIASNSCGTTSLVANTACQLTVAFAPTAVGPATGTLTFIDAAGTQTVVLTGTGATPPTDTLSAAALAFPGTVIGQLSSPQTISVTNSGDESLTSIAISISGVFQASNNCTTVLPGHASCAISVIFAPSQVGVQTGTLTIADLVHTQVVTLTGTGVQPPAFGVSPPQLIFATVDAGASSPPATLTVSNTGGAPLAHPGFQIVGSSAGSFATGATTCGPTLSNGSSCTVQVTFTPATTGGNTATLVVSSSSVGVVLVSVPLNGTGHWATGLNVNPPQLNFPVVIAGQSSAVQTVTITNMSGSTASAPAVTISPQFGVAQNRCLGSMNAGGSCTVGVVFQPTSSGPVTGALTIRSASIAISATVALSGGMVTIQTKPGLLTFPSTGVGTAGSPLTLTVSNPGTLAGLSGLSLAASPGFQLVNNTCPATLGPQSSCTTGVVSAPTSAGVQSGILTITSSTLPDAATVQLAGMGFDFTVGQSGAASQSVSNGQTASYDLVLTPLNGSQGTFTFQCGSVPLNAVCSFNPSTEAVGANSSSVVRVQIATGQPVSVSQLNGGGEPASRGTGAWRLSPLLCGLAVLPLALWRRRRVLLLVASLAFLVGGVSSCASFGTGTGSTTGQGGAGGTPAGTYSIPVTVISTGVQHSVTLTLAVD